MSVNIEYCDPFSGDRSDIWMKIEHCGRYLFAGEFLADKKCASVIDLAASNGYGSRMLADFVPRVTAADRSAEYLDSPYLRGTGIRTLCFDFDSEAYPEELHQAEAAVCFETLEHLREPFRFLEKLAGRILPGGWLILSFPNAEYEILNPDGTNRDPYHLHILNLSDVRKEIEKNGFRILFVLGQPVSNVLCTRQHDLKEEDPRLKEDINNAFRYDERSIRALSRLMAWPQEEDVDKSYSYIIIARKL